jgi:hypothetical protein
VTAHAPGAAPPVSCTSDDDRLRVGGRA